MKVIGITGGVGSGKSRILSYIEEQFRAVICQADHVAWELQKPGQTCYKKIVAHFGPEIINEDETINRSKLGAIVFAHPEQLLVLNQIMHPAVKKFIQSWIKTEENQGTDLFVIEAALLLEENYDQICDELWYIYVSSELRRKRLKESRQYSDEKIDHIMGSQLSEEDFRKGCKVVVDNNGSFEETCLQIDKYVKAILHLR